MHYVLHYGIQCWLPTLPWARSVARTGLHTAWQSSPHVHGLEEQPARSLPTLTLAWWQCAEAHADLWWRLSQVSNAHVHRHVYMALLVLSGGSFVQQHGMHIILPWSSHSPWWHNHVCLQYAMYEGLDRLRSFLMCTYVHVHKQHACFLCNVGALAWT